MTRKGQSQSPSGKVVKKRRKNEVPAADLFCSCTQESSLPDFFCQILIGPSRSGQSTMFALARLTAFPLGRSRPLLPGTLFGCGTTRLRRAHASRFPGDDVAELRAASANLHDNLRRHKTTTFQRASTTLCPPSPRSLSPSVIFCD